MEWTDTISHFLTNTLHVVELILSYLNARDLNSSATVCKAWSDVVQLLKRKRKTRSWTCLTSDIGEEDDEIDTDFFRIATQEFIQNLYTEPCVMFMFCQSDLYDSFHSRPTSTAHGRHGRTRAICQSLQFNEFVKSLLPRDCELLATTSGGIIGTESDCSKIHEIENNYGVSFLCLPRCDKLTVVSRDHEERRRSDTWDIDSLMQIPPNTSCPLMMLTMIMEPNMTRSITANFNNKYPSMVLAGGIVDELLSNNQAIYPVLRCTAICGSDVKVASVVLNESVNTEKQAEECIKSLKQHKLSEQNSFAFIFACIGRGAEFYRNPNVESCIFKKHFPKTPLLGIFGNGEIGFDCVSNSSNDAQEPSGKKLCTSPPKLHHTYTTILVLVSI